jgi:hypothetical protein
MSIPFENKKFRINPIELAIFAVVSLIFVKSGYSLFYSSDRFDPNALTATARNPIDTASTNSRTDGRALASTTAQKTFSEVKIGCDPSAVSPSVSAKKIRLIGALCKPAPAEVPGTTAASDGPKESTQSATETTSVAQAAVPAATAESAASVKKISVVNTSANVAATVFPDYSKQRFSTDYISLNQGKNLIYVQYEFKDGKTLGQEFAVYKN